MSTIQTKRKKSGGNANVTLVAAEPYYNLADKTLYLGDANGTNTFEGKKHIAELSVSSDTARQLKLAIGEAKGNEVILKVAHTNSDHPEGVEVSGKTITLYVDSYTKNEIENLNTTIAGQVDTKITNATTLHLTANEGGTSNVRVGTDTDNSFDVALAHTMSTEASEGVFWNDSDNKLYIIISAYTKLEVDEKVATLSEDITTVSNDLRDNYYAKTDTYSKTETNNLVSTATRLHVTGSYRAAQVQIGNNDDNSYGLYVNDEGIESDGELHNGWTVNKGSITLNLKPYYTKNEVDGMINEGIAGKMSVENGVLKFSNS